MECELNALAIAMQTFIAILDEIVEIEDVTGRNEDLRIIIDLLNDITGKLFGFRCESWEYNKILSKLTETRHKVVKLIFYIFIKF